MHWDISHASYVVLGRSIQLDIKEELALQQMKLRNNPPAGDVNAANCYCVFSGPAPGAAGLARAAAAVRAAVAAAPTPGEKSKLKPLNPLSSCI